MGARHGQYTQTLVPFTDVFANLEPSGVEPERAASQARRTVRDMALRYALALETGFSSDKPVRLNRSTRKRRKKTSLGGLVERQHRCDGMYANIRGSEAPGFVQ